MLIVRERKRIATVMERARRKEDQKHRLARAISLCRHAAGRTTEYRFQYVKKRTMQLVVIFVSGRKAVVKVPRASRVDVLLATVAKQCQNMCSTRFVTASGKELQRNRLLSDYNLQSESLLIESPDLRGGMHNGGGGTGDGAGAGFTGVGAGVGAGSAVPVDDVSVLLELNSTKQLDGRGYNKLRKGMTIEQVAELNLGGVTIRDGRVVELDLSRSGITSECVALL